MKDISPIPGKPGFYRVPSSDGRRSYEVHQETFTCQCPHYVYRCAGTLHLCRHGKALHAYLAAIAACPVCSAKPPARERCVLGMSEADLKELFR